MEEDKITLDRGAFKALASDTRVQILKSLDRRRKMLAELSKQLGMSPSTVKEHMESLVSAGLAVQIDDGHKWKYYELTKKGSNVLHPDQTRIWILLSVSLLGMIAAGLDMLRAAAEPRLMAFSQATSGMAEKTLPSAGRGLGDSAVPPMLPSPVEAASQIPLLHIAAMVAFGVVFAVCAFSIIRGRKKA